MMNKKDFLVSLFHKWALKGHNSRKLALKIIPINFSFASEANN
jgi:hypothetical protein